MVIHEYQAKQLFRSAGIPLPDGEVADGPVQAGEIAGKMGKRVAVKAQVHAGGRGKAGGIKLASSADEASTHAQSIIGMQIKGLTVRKVLVEEAIDIDREFYVGIILDRTNNCHLLMFSPVGGMDIEEVAEKTPEQIYRYELHPALGLLPYQVSDLVTRLDVSPETRKGIADIVNRLWQVYVQYDALLAEINPLAVLKDGRVVAADAKFNVDDNAMFRQKALTWMEEFAEDDPLEREAKAKGLAYVRLHGDVGIVGNGAGLVMTTLDMVSREGGKPANFLDVGGGASAAVVKKSLETVLSDPHVKGVLFNIFGGITRGDEVAKGILEATSSMDLKLPVVIRLAGTRADEGRALLKGSKFEPAETMSEAAAKIVERIGAAN